MVKVAEEVQSLRPDVSVQLLTIELKDGTTLRYTNAIRDINTTVLYDGDTFNPRQFIMSKVKIESGGPLPRPTLGISNVDGTFWPLEFASNQSLRAATVTFIEIHKKFLDGESDADTTQYSHKSIWKLWQTVKIDEQRAEFKLSTAMDVEQVKFGRPVLRDICPRGYRVPIAGAPDTFTLQDCPYGDPVKRPGTGANYFKKDGTPTVNYLEDACGKRLASCKLRFGEDVDLPFKGFVSVGSNRNA